MPGSSSDDDMIVDADMDMPTVEVGGMKRKCRESRLSPHTMCIDVRPLPNPHNAIKNKMLDESVEAITAWLREKKPQTFNFLVDKAVAHVLNGNDVRIVCHGGRHRSQAVGNAVLDLLANQQIDIIYHVLESPLSRR